MNALDQWCVACRGSHPHERTKDGVVCSGCATPTAVPQELLDLAFARPAVQDMRFCAWCKATCPVGHDCPAGAVGCMTRQPDETPCGACERCQEVQRQDVALREQLHRYGSPSDLYTP